MSIERSIVFNFFKAPADKERQSFACDTCCGEGEIDQRLGGAHRSGVVKCPDCDGLGHIARHSASDGEMK